MEELEEIYNEQHLPEATTSHELNLSSSATVAMDISRPANAFQNI